MYETKWYFISFGIGFILGAAIIFAFVLRHDHKTITGLRAESERAAIEYRKQITEYNILLGDARERVGELQKSLDAETRAYTEAIGRVGNLEERLRKQTEIERSAEESNSRAIEYNRSIRKEAENALGELREYIEAIGSSPDNS